MTIQHKFPILVIEDSELINKTLCSYLSNSRLPGFEVFSAYSLKEAREVLSTHAIEFIILDLELPDGTGEELMGYLGSTELYLQSKVIVLTGSIEKKRREHLFQLGIIDYLSKDNPINFLANEIKKSVAQFLAHQDTCVLVVDDSQFFADHVASVLRNQNYTVHTCIESTQVYDFLKENIVNLLITDLEMPQMDGIELLRQIRKDDNFLDLPIIGLSGTTNQDMISRLLKSGANDFLAKPFIIENLLLKVDVTVSLYKKQRKLSELNQFLQEEIKNKVEEIRTKDQVMELDNRHAQMGQMINALTHQWKQPLHGITLAAEYLKEDFVAPGQKQEVVQTIQEQVRFLTETMDYFRHFFKPHKEMERFSPFQAFQNIFKLLGDTYHEIDISLKGDENLFVLGYPNEFYQVIINLLNNAQDAFREKRVLHPQVFIEVFKEHKKIMIVVRDNAGGIPESVIERIFDQFVTTKGSKGTGIGLQMVYSVLKKISGKIEVRNVKEGAEFIMSLPEGKSL